MSEKSKNNIDNMNESLYFKIINKARLEIAKCILNLLRKDHNTINSTQLSKDSTSSVFLKYRFETKHQIYSVRDNANKVEDIDSNDILILLHFGNTKNQFEDSSKVINVIVDNKYNNEAGTFFYLKRDFENNKLSKDLNTIKFPLNDNNFDSNEEYKNQIFYKYVPFYYLKNKDNKINDCDSENPEEKKNDNNDKEKNNESNEILKYQKVINDRVFNSLKSKEVYIPNPYQLNDLYDCTNLLMMFYIMLKQKLKSTELKEELEGLYSKISDENDFDIYDKDAVYNKFLSLSTSYSQELQNQIKNLETSFSKLNSFYIFSLTTTSSNSLMWAHYANANNGLCFGYKGEDIIKLINNIKEYAFVFFNPVNYQNKPTTRQIISKIEYFYKYDIKDKLSFLILSFFKNSIWNYENEYRIVIDIKDFDKFEHEYELKFNHKFDHKYPLSPSEIIFGPGWRKDEISSFLNEHKDINKLQKMDKFYASISKEDYKININEYTD